MDAERDREKHVIKMHSFSVATCAFTQVVPIVLRYFHPSGFVSLPSFEALEGILTELRKEVDRLDEASPSLSLLLSLYTYGTGT